MNFLKTERQLLEKYIPNLNKKLASIPFYEMETNDNPAIQIFRDLNGPGLLIPTEYGGKGITPLEAILVQRAIGSRAPSLAIATTMHHFTLATIIEMLNYEEEYELLKQIASQNLYVASGFAEGKTGSSILSPSIQAHRNSDGVVIVNGNKKPCSLSASMDLLTVSVMIPALSGNSHELAMIIIPANSSGIERHPFWVTPILGGAESDSVVLNNVQIPEECISYLGEPGNLDSVQAKGFIWFELLISASYLGIVSALVEKVLCASKGIASERNILVLEIEGAMSSLEGVAYSLMQSHEKNEDDVARAFFVRHSVQRSIERCSFHAVELLGGIEFISNPEIGYLMSAARALAFHPPSRLSISSALDKYLLGESLKI